MIEQYQVNLAPEVIAELAAIYEYIALDKVTAAQIWLDNIESKIYSLASNPERCPLAIENRFHKFEIRNLIVGNYRVLFRIRNQNVEILHVKHSKMAPKPL